MNKKPLAIYIHIPFCMRKCTYCDFLSFCVPHESQAGQTRGKNTTDSDTLIETYLLSLCREIAACDCGVLERASHKDAKVEHSYTVDTIFIGGGTPSLLSPEQIGRIVEAVSERFPVEKDAEISMESNPGSFYQNEKPGGSISRETMVARLKDYKKAGINRLSIGAQSLQGETLRFLGRLHTREQFLESYEAARRAGFDNINVDMMFGVPQMGFDPWQEDIRQIVALQPEHVSFYSLQLEEGTPLWRLYEQGAFEEPDPALDRRMYGAALEILDHAGYIHYEISNAAKPGKACRHNLKYWSMEEYIGFGLGASSYLRFGGAMTGSRRMNTSDMDEYIQAVQTDWQPNTLQDEISEYIFTGLRKIRGIRTDEFTERFGKDIGELYEKQIIKLCHQGLLVFDDGYLHLTRRGIDLSNCVFVEFV